MIRPGIAGLAAVCLLLSACGKVPVEAPEELGELTQYLFVNYESETGEELVAGLVQLEAYMLDLDLSAELDDRAVTPPNLTDTHLEGVTYPTSVDLEAQVPVAVSYLSDVTMDDHYSLMLEPNQVCIASNGTLYHERVFLTDTACFVDGTCELLETTNEIRFENFLAKVWLDEFQNYRNVELEDGRVAVIQRSWMEQQYDSDNGSSSWDLRFAISVRLPSADDDSQTLRFNSFWSSVTIPGVGDDIYAALVKDGIDEGFMNEDGFITGAECDNDRDREYDRP